MTTTTTGPTTIHGFMVDVATTTEHTDAAEVTKFPVEKGADLTDHVRRTPTSLTMEATVSDTPIGALVAEREAAAAAGVQGRPTEQARAHFESLLAAGEPILVVTEVRVYEDMVLTSFVEPRDAKTGEALNCRLQFEHMTLVTNRRTTIRTATPRGGKKRKLGSKAAEDATKKPPAAKAVDGQSVLSETVSGRHYWLTSTVPGGR